MSPGPRAALRSIAARDPNGAAWHAAVRAAVVVPANFAIGSQVIGNAQTATFAAFGSFALLLFATFRGSRAARLGAYLILAGVGAVLICLGTVAATPDWLAVVAMAVVVFGVQFAGVVSSTVNNGVLAALLTFILSVMVPGVRADVGARLAGWGLACAVAIPVAVLVWPPRDQNVLRARTAQLCAALGAMLSLEPPEPGTPDRLVAMRRAAGELRTVFRTSVTGTHALNTSGRLLIRLVDEVEWLTAAVSNACAQPPETWPEPGRRLRVASAAVLATCADVLASDATGPARAAGADLDRCVSELDDARRAVAASTIVALRERATRGGADVRAAGEFEQPLYVAHELGYAVGLAGRTVATIEMADARPWSARLLGRDVPLREFGVAQAAQRSARGHLDRHSVWLQSSLRAAIGLALAVLLARVSGNQNAFWIGLGALSVLRSNALSTGVTVLRALAGTVAGFVVGGALVAAIGSSPSVLWPLLPVAVFIAAVAPALISFAAGQAAFTLFSIILFNIIAPIGWHVGEIRVADVALGCAASLVAGVLFWPRGAAAALSSAYADAFDTAAVHLQDSVDALVGRGVGGPLGSSARSGELATAAGIRLDDALRQYFAEQGAKSVPVESVAALANGAGRLRLAAVAIDALRRHAPGQSVVPADNARLQRPAEAIEGRTQQLRDWYAALGGAFASRGARELPGVDDSRTGESFLALVLPAVDGCGDADQAERAEKLLWSGQYLGDVDRLRGELTTPARQVVAAQRRHPILR